MESAWRTFIPWKILPGPHHSLSLLPFVESVTVRRLPLPYLFRFWPEKGREILAATLSRIIIFIIIIIIITSVLPQDWSKPTFRRVFPRRENNHFFPPRKLEKEMGICSHLFAFASRSTRTCDYLFFRFYAKRAKKKNWSFSLVKKVRALKVRFFFFLFINSQTRISKEFVMKKKSCLTRRWFRWISGSHYVWRNVVLVVRLTQHRNSWYKEGYKRDPSVCV